MFVAWIFILDSCLTNKENADCTSTYRIVSDAISWYWFAWTGFLNVIDVTSGVSLFVLLLPGPAYVHLSWAPRWRLLCKLDQGLNPFVGLEAESEPPKHSADELAGEDLELLEVVDAFESE